MAVQNTRRRFLKNVGCGIIAAPLAASLGTLVVSTVDAAPTQAAVLERGKLSLNIVDFGAIGDGKTKDTEAIQVCIDRCSIFGGGDVVVPKGVYLIGTIALHSGVYLRLEEGSVIKGSHDFNDYLVTQVRWEGKWIMGYAGLIHAIGSKNIGIIGKGKILGDHDLGGRPNADNPLRRPALIEPIDCTNVTLEGFSTDYHSMWSIHLTYCENVTVKNLTIRSTGGNGDGIDVDSCRRVVIDNCDIATGDDCISLKSGRGMEGFTLARATEDVTITNCTFAGNIFACIGIGSETSGGIRNLRMEHCKFTNAKTFAVYIKSNIGRGAFIEDLTFDNLDIANANGGFLRFNITGSGLADEEPVTGEAGIPFTRNFKFTNIRVNNVSVLIDGVDIHPNKPLDGLLISDISGICGKGISLANVKNTTVKNVSVTGFAGSLLNVSNVKGTGLTDAKTLPDKKYPSPLPPSGKPYQLR